MGFAYFDEYLIPQTPLRLASVSVILILTRVPRTIPPTLSETVHVSLRSDPATLSSFACVEKSKVGADMKGLRVSAAPPVVHLHQTVQLMT